MAFSIFPVFLLLLAGTSSVTNDLVSLLNADDYFQSRKVDLQATRLAELAAKDPGDAKSQIAQLLAIRWLGEHPTEVKKASTAHEILEEIAGGRKGDDPQGFAREYARRALARLDNKPLPKPQTIPGKSLSAEGLQWFPADATLVAGVDLRASAESKSNDELALTQLMAKLLPRQEREMMYQFAEGVGNLRLDRFSFAYAANPQEKRKGRIFLRFTGLGNRKWLADHIHLDMPGTDVKEEKGPKGEQITLISRAKNPPAFALVGDTDFLMAGPEDNSNSLEIIKEALEVRAGNKASVVTGPLADRLKSVPGQTAALLVGNLPEELRQEISRGGPIPAVPHDLLVYLVRGQDLSLHFQGTMDSAEDATAFADSINKLKQLGADALQNLPPDIKIKPDSLRLLSNTLENFKMEAKGSGVKSDLEIPGAVPKVVEGLITDFIKSKVPVGPDEIQPVPGPAPLPPGAK